RLGKKLNKTLQDPANNILLRDLDELEKELEKYDNDDLPTPDKGSIPLIVLTFSHFVIMEQYVSEIVNDYEN
ncbi:4796_t:CDS:2, partial [Entrophospora sp. SA101]